MSEEFDNVSTYNYGVNNPILMVDPNGMYSDTTKNVSPQPKPIQLDQVNIVGLNGPDIKPYSGFWGHVEYFFTGGINGRYQYNLEGKSTGLAPKMGFPPNIGTNNPLGVLKSLKKIFSSVKKDIKLLKLARETFKGNEMLRKEANGLIEQLKMEI